MQQHTSREVEVIPESAYRSAQDPTLHSWKPKYVSSEEAKEKLRRRQDKGDQVRRWWYEQGYGQPRFLPSIYFLGVLARPIATRRYEDVVFQRISERANLMPWWLQFTGVRVTNCSRHCTYLRPTVIKGRTGVSVREDFRPAENPFRNQQASFQDVQRNVGSSVVSLTQSHMACFRTHDAETQRNVSDMFRWISKSSSQVQKYAQFLSLFISEAVLFENFLAAEPGAMNEHFLKAVVIPAFRLIEDFFEVAPLVVKMPDWDPLLGYYPHSRGAEDLVYDKGLAPAGKTRRGGSGTFVPSGGW